jgi:lysozyme
MVIDEEEAERLLLEDLVRTEKELKALLDIELNENEWSAIVSLSYNLGVGGFSRTLAYERLAAGDRQGAADAFLYLDSAVIDGVRQEIASLRARRERERELFLTPVVERSVVASP